MSWKLLKITIFLYIIFLFIPGIISEVIAYKYTPFIIIIIWGSLLYGAYKLLVTTKWEKGDFLWGGLCNKWEYIKNTVGYALGWSLLYIIPPISGFLSIFRVYLAMFWLTDLYNTLLRFDDQYRGIIVLFGYMLLLLFMYTCFIDSFRRINTLWISRKFLILLLIPGINIIFIWFLIFSKVKEKAIL